MLVSLKSVSHQFITEVLFLLYFILCLKEFWSVNYTLLYQNSELTIFKNIFLFFGEISNNLQNDLFGTNVYKILKSARFLRINITSVICKWGTL